MLALKPPRWQKGAKQCSGQHPPEPGGWGSPSTAQGLEVDRSCSEEEAMHPPPSFSVTQLTWPPYFPTSPAASSSTPSSTWVPSGCSRCSSQTRPSCRASCSSASSQVRGPSFPGCRGGGREAEAGGAGALLCAGRSVGGGQERSCIRQTPPHRLCLLTS